MHKPKRILVAVDGSSHSRSAVDYVASVCSTATFVNLLYVLPKRPEEVFWQVNLDEEFILRMRAKYDDWEMEQRSTGRAFLEAGRAALVKAGFEPDRVGSILRERQAGTAADVVAEAAQGYDALVVGRRGLNKMNSLFLGSVSDKIVELMQEIPVWIVGGDVRSHRMLVAVDGSENSAKAVEYMAGFAADLCAEITLCHVIRGEEAAFGVPVLELDREISLQLEEWRGKELQKMFAGYRACLARAGVQPGQVTARCVTHSFSRAADLLREAREGGCGAIVMGRRGISKVREFLMGRVTTKVLNGAEDLAVWIVP